MVIYENKNYLQIDHQKPMQLYYWDFRDANTQHKQKLAKFDQEPDQFGTIAKLKKIIRPENIFFQAHKNPEGQNPED